MAKKTSQQKFLMVANWKMNPVTAKEAVALFTATKKSAGTAALVETVVCPPALFLPTLAKIARGERCVLGAQDAAIEKKGAFTGSISAEQVADAKAKYVIVGHSERRAAGETSAAVNAKIRAAGRAGLIPIICVGETERDSQHLYLDTLRNQIQETFRDLTPGTLKKMLIAYEPIWGISAQHNRPATPAESQEMVIFIKQVLADQYSAEVAKNLRVLYGGSVNIKNVEEFMKEGGIDGVLVGSASLNAKEFSSMVALADRVKREGN